ncbi:MAG: JDVT-CTERM system glutamic-type intramembrane protease [Nitrospira sp.]|nr:JDVT-CTERM system glutamic-type intramembrane protease [Nitrospira sp.]
MKLSLGSRGTSLQQKRPSDCPIAEQNASSHVPSPSSHAEQVLVSLGLHYHRPFHRDAVFLLLLALGPVVWLAMMGFSAFQPLPWHAIWSPVFLSIAIWQPLLEELLFRGAMQGQVLQTRWGQKTWLGLSMANLIVSLFFALAHLVGHSISWALLVFAPSLCFGFARDRFGSVYPAIVLHAFYNAGYFLLIGGTSLLNSR